MGKAIEEIALGRGYEIVLRINSSNPNEFTFENISKADVAIEFSNPHSAPANIKRCIEAGVPVICGSTGWVDKLSDIRNFVQEKSGGFLYASNFSVGVNIFFELNKKLASLMSGQKEYEVILEEIHHTQKKDAPSGTAITLAEQILENVERKKRWVNNLSDNPDDLEIISQRVDPTPGTHSVTYSSAIDTISITHTAHNRKGFAFGALMAAEFIKNKKGFFSMKDVLHL